LGPQVGQSVGRASRFKARKPHGCLANGPLHVPRTATGDLLSRRLKITLPEPLAAELERTAEATGEPMSRVAAQAIRERFGGLVADAPLLARAPAQKGVPRQQGTSRAPWLDPYGGDPQWRSTMWGAIVALHGRYPRHLENLREGWWNDEAQTELLGALAVWRDEIDDAGRDPREELAFHHQLEDFSHILRQAGGGVESIWKPGPPPDDWAAASALCPVGHEDAVRLIGRFGCLGLYS
jgi:hypothetical protein